MKHFLGRAGRNPEACPALLFWSTWLYASLSGPLPAAAAPTFYAQELAEIDAAVEQTIADKGCPGGVLWLEHTDTSYHKAYGHRALVPDNEPMSEDTIF